LDSIDRDDFGEHDAGLAGLSTDWSVPWSDLMMVMFILFVVLYSYDRAERPVREAFGERDPALAAAPAIREPRLPSPESVLEQSRRAAAEVSPEEIEVVLHDSRTVRVSVHGDAFFDLGKAELRPETSRLLDRLSRVLTGNDLPVHVVGHTDSFPVHGPSYPTNWELSTARATNVVRYLIEHGDLAPERFGATGYAMYRPTVPNDSPANKALNRRVDILVGGAGETP
jgi:chemotaxis protein MotB